MSQRHARRKRRPRFQRPDTINIFLGSLTIILLLAWGGLHWKESRQQALIANAEGAALNAQTQPEGAKVIATGPVSTSPAGVTKPAAADKAGEPAEQPTAAPAASVEPTALPEKEEAVKTAAPVKAAEPVKTTKPATTAKPNQETVTKPQAVATPKPKPKPKPKPGTPVVKETEPPISASQKYEQQIAQLQANCTQDMNEVLAGAEASIEQLDKSDPYAFQQLNQKWVDGLENAQNACNAKFQKIITNAENDAVEPAVTEKWEGTFSSLMLQLKGEFEEKLLQLMGG